MATTESKPVGASGKSLLDVLGLRSRVARRLLIWAMVFGGISSLLVSTGEAILSYRERLEYLDSHLKAMGEFTVPVLIQSVWNFDRTKMELQLQGFSRLPEVTAVRLRMAGAADMNFGRQVRTEETLERSFPLVHAEEGTRHDLGTLTLITDLREDRAKMMRHGVISFFGNTLVILLIVIVAVFGYQAIVTRRLLVLADELRNLTADDLRRALPPAQAEGVIRDELDELAASILALKGTARQALRDMDEKHSLMRSLMDSIPDLVWLKNQDGVYLACNPRFEKFFGRAEADILGKNDYDFFDRDLAEFFRNNDRLAVEAGGPRTNEEWLTFVDGGYHGLFETIKTPMKTGDGRFIGVLGIARDISHQRQAAEELREREELFHSIVSQAADGIDLVDVATLRILEVNDAACRMMGYSREEYLALSLPDTQPDMDEPALRGAIGQVLAAGSASLESRHRAKDGRVFDVQVNVRAIKLRGRDCLVAVWRDISQEKAARIALENEAEWHRALIQNSVEGIAIFDEERRVIETNLRFAQMLGLAPEEMLGLHPWDWDAGFSQEAARSGFPISPQVSTTFETRHRRKDGSVYDAEVSLQGARIGERHIFVSIIRDITERKQARENLRAREEIYRSIVTQAGDGIVLIEPESFHFAEFNDAACQALGYQREEFARLNLMDLQFDAHADRDRAALAELAASDTVNYETRHRRKDGSACDVLISSRPVRVHGQTYITAVWHDISTHKAAEAAIREERQVRETILESIPGIFYALDVQGKMVFWNRNMELATERSAAELSGLNALDLFDGKDQERVAERIREVFVHGHSVVEADMVGQHGLRTPFFFTGLRIEMAGQPLLVGTGIDVSARKQAEEDLRLLNAQLEQRVSQRTAALEEAHNKLLDTQFAMESVGIGIFWVDFDSGRIIYVNRFAAGFLGYTAEEMAQLTVSDIDLGFPPEAFGQINQKIRDLGHMQIETSQRRKDGSLVPVEMTIYYHAGSSASAPRLIAFLTDITRRKESERALLRAKEASEAANVAKSAFLANMSHEIRTPINAITGMAHLIRKSGLTPKQAERLGKLEAASEHLLAVINAILELSKIEAGKFALEESPFRVETLLGNVVSMLHDRAQEKKLQLITEAREIPAHLLGDATRLQQALLNYATNAIKFTEAGSVTLRVSRLEEDEDSALLRFEVADTGIGVEEETLRRLFTAFEQADSSTTRKYGGTGLGLTITKRIAQLMGGDAGADSVPGKGSTFWFTVRLRKGKLAAATAGAHEGEDAEEVIQRDFAGARILLAEDEPINREITSIMLEDVGLTVDVAEDGLKAVALAGSQTYALILMDMQMPNMDGLQATALIRRLPQAARVPILAMTANAFTEDRERCMASGMNDFIAKPFVPEQMYATLLKWLSGGT